MSVDDERDMVMGLDVLARLDGDERGCVLRAMGVYRCREARKCLLRSCHVHYRVCIAECIAHVF